MAPFTLLALALVLVFAATRVIFIAQGEFVAFGALTLAGLQAGRLPGTIRLLLALLIVSVAVHVTFIGLGLFFFGAEGSRTLPFTEVSFAVGDALLQGQTVLVVVASLVLIVALYFFFERTIYGKALRATAMNRTGARLMGISSTLAGMLSFTLIPLLVWRMVKTRHVEEE